MSPSHMSCVGKRSLCKYGTCFYVTRGKDEVGVAKVLLIGECHLFGVVLLELFAPGIVGRVGGPCTCTCLVGSVVAECHGVKQTTSTN